MSVREWINKVPDPSWSPALKKAHARFGGNKELSWLEMQNLLALMITLQEQANILEALLLKQVPKKVRAEQDSYVKLIKQNGGQVFNNDMPFCRWSNPGQFVNGVLSLFYRENCILLQTNKNFTKEPVSLSVPFDLVRPFISAYQELTGHEPPASVYLFILYYSEFRHIHIPHPSGDLTLPYTVNWGMSAVTIPL